jgi:hypothetical protein
MADVVEVVLHLSKQTAQDLYDALYMLGEHIAAGAPIVSMGHAADERLARVMWSITAQLGRPTLYHIPAPAPDEVL